MSKTVRTFTPNANDRFIHHCLRIDRALESLQKMRAEHFDVDGDKGANWGDVGSAEEVANLVERAVLFAHGQGT